MRLKRTEGGYKRRLLASLLPQSLANFAWKLELATGVDELEYSISKSLAANCQLPEETASLQSTLVWRTGLSERGQVGANSGRYSDRSLKLGGPNVERLPAGCSRARDGNISGPTLEMCSTA